MRLLVITTLLLAGPGCGTLRHLRAPPADARHHVISLRDLPTGDLLVDGAAFLEEDDAVYRANSNLARAEIEVWTRAERGPEALVSRLASRLAVRGVNAVAGAGQGSYRPPPGFAEGADARILTNKGEDVEDLSAHTVPGKVTVFDFYADWCGPCRVLDRQLRQITAARSDVAVRKLNIVDFNSPVAAHFVRGAIPLLIVYNRSGHKVGELRGNDPMRIIVALGRATVSKD
jgi:thiol-disulfide isomerase/thioredoxin